MENRLLVIAVVAEAALQRSVPSASMSREEHKAFIITSIADAQDVDEDVVAKIVNEYDTTIGDAADNVWQLLRTYIDGKLSK